jgi:two-component system phosphate regulon sensor histidine kinase PhoR
MYIAYKEVEEAKDNTDAILKSIGDGVFVVDNQGIVVLMNQVAEQMSDISSHQAIGRHYYDVFKFGYEENPQKTFPHLVEKILSQQEYREDNTNHPIIHNLHGDTPILLTASAIKDHVGKVVGCVVVMIDMSKIRELERSKDNFLSLAAHQLGTPLGAVRWYTQMLLSGDMGKISAKVKETMKEIEENNQRMVNLVNKLLDVSRIDQKSVKEIPEPVQLEKVVAEVINNLKTHAFQKKVTVHFTPPTSPLSTIIIDPDLLREVITNLVANAIRYNKPEGSVTIVLAEKIETLHMIIKDTGIGIPQEDQDKIYSKFFRAGNAKTKVTDGTGLGLFVAKSYLEGWGGGIEFTSKENEGTTFTVTLPKKPTLHVLSAHLVELNQETSSALAASASKKKKKLL